MNIYPFASNHIKDVKKVFIQELQDLYSKSEADVLFNRILEHIGIFEKKDVGFNQSELILLSRYIDKLKQDIPIEYILGYTYFYDLKILVNENVLIPRPETEELVYRVKDIIQKKYGKGCDLKMIDIGTGSGCIAIALKKLFPNASVDAVDISEKAIEIAKRNAMAAAVPINFYQCDILLENLLQKYDAIVGNPPYIPIKDKLKIDKRVLNNEPPVALFSDTPTLFYERIFLLAQKHLNDNGIIFLELNQFYATEVLKTAQRFEGFENIQLLKDWSGNERFIQCFRKFKR